MTSQQPMNVVISGTTTQIDVNSKDNTGLFIKAQAEKAPGAPAGTATLLYTIKDTDNAFHTYRIDDVPLKVGSGAFSEDSAHVIEKLELKKIRLLPQRKIQLTLLSWWDTPHLTIINDTDKPIEHSFLFARDMFGYSIEEFSKGKYGGKKTIQQRWTYVFTIVPILIILAIIAAVVVPVIVNGTKKSADNNPPKEDDTEHKPAE